MKNSKETYIADCQSLLEINKQIKELKSAESKIIEKYEKWLRKGIEKHHNLDRHHKICFGLKHILPNDVNNKYLYVELEDLYDHRDEVIDSYRIPIDDLFDEQLDFKQFSSNYKAMLKLEEEKKKKQEEKKKKQAELLKLSKEELVEKLMKKE